MQLNPFSLHDRRRCHSQSTSIHITVAQSSSASDLTLLSDLKLRAGRPAELARKETEEGNSGRALALGCSAVFPSCIKQVAKFRPSRIQDIQCMKIPLSNPEQHVLFLPSTLRRSDLPAGRLGVRNPEEQAQQESTETEPLKQGNTSTLWSKARWLSRPDAWV